jgi:hypothetical protein
VAAQRVAADDGARDVQRVQEPDDVPAQLADGGSDQARIEEGQGQRDGTAPRGQPVHRGLPVVEISEQAE